MDWVSTIIKSLVGGLGTSYAAKKNLEGQEKSANWMMEGSMPWDIGGAMGNVTFGDGSVDIGLSPEQQAQYDAYTAEAAEQNRLLTSLRGEAAGDLGDKYYQQEMALLAPEQEQERLALESRLFSQGFTPGSTASATSSGMLRKAQGDTRLEARRTADDRVQDLIDNYTNRRNAATTGAMGIAGFGLDLADFGANVGQGLSGAAQQGGLLMGGAYEAQNAARAGFATETGKAIGDTYNATTSSTAGTHGPVSFGGGSNVTGTPIVSGNYSVY
jgi:hypothetical protein